MINREVMAKCKRCGKGVPTSELVLDPVYRAMVCRNCVKERQAKEYPAQNTQKVQEQKPKEPEKPEDWDKDDDTLTRLYKYKQQTTPKLVMVDRERAKCRCSNCGYGFLYNVDKKYPKNCPHCGTPVNTR